MEIKNKIRSFMTTEFSKSGFGEDFSDDRSLIDAGILDSLSILKLISFMDEEFHFIPSDDELMPDRLDSVNKIADFIKKKTG